MRLALAFLLLFTSAVAGAQTIAEEQRALIQARQEAATAISRAQRYEAAAARATNAAEAARADAVAIAARIQESEAEIAVARARVAIIERLRRIQRSKLAARQGPIVRLTAALQTMARRPPILAIVQPGSLDDLIHVRMMLATTLPLIRERTADLREDVARVNQLRADAVGAVATLHAKQSTLDARRHLLAQLEAGERLESRRYGESAKFEQERAQGMAERAHDIVDLMGEMDQQAVTSARLASLPGPAPRPARPGDATAPPADIQPRAATRPAYRLPVLGRVITGLGEISKTGIRSRGLTFATRPGAQVVSPTGGRISFAGEFRGYGQIVIIDHGGGWTTLITGLGSLSVGVGDTVVQGSPIGLAGNDNPRVTVELRRGGEPINIAPLAAQS